MGKYFDMLMEDVRMREGLHSCMNCGVCTGVCPAAEFYNYDPRQIVNIVQTQDDDAIEELMRSDVIWYCGECMSCRPRCPRGNTPAYVIQALRTLSQKLGFFVESEKGRQQLALKRTIGENILRTGYCVTPKLVKPELHPEQGTVWEWIYENDEEIYGQFSAAYNRPGAGALRKLDDRSMEELHRIFDVTGGKEFFDTIEKHSDRKAREMGYDGADDEYMMDTYTKNSNEHYYRMKRSSWSDYQKEIADDKYYYVRSCIRQNFFPGSEKAFLNMLQKDLGRDVFDDPLHTSCTGIGYHSDIVPLDTIMTVVARQFALMTDAGYENFISSCITSFGIYTEILATWEEFPEKEEQTREYLYKATGREFRKPKSLAHTSDIVFHLREEIARKAKYRLVNAATGEPLRVVEHIGCHYAKIFPKAGIGGSEFPYVLAGMIDAWGGQCVDYPERRHCCGFGFRNYLVQGQPGLFGRQFAQETREHGSLQARFHRGQLPRLRHVPRQMAIYDRRDGGRHLRSGRTRYSGADVRGDGRSGAGVRSWELGMQMHQVDVEPLLEKWASTTILRPNTWGVTGNSSGNRHLRPSIAAFRI